MMRPNCGSLSLTVFQFLRDRIELCLFINQGSGSVNRVKIFQRQIKLMKKFNIVLCLVLKGKESWEKKK